ncbi:MAG: tRNA (adenosine(37)-N6)-threonylcarbamoyltransferase complex ATPase subunit type 1 TsaE [Caldilineaceae bacterium]|nr:tRNA (adenosine(37)-N6)-threonylcarbamoyltransferase complex ATPase subunit type 1 TsaE [Caldilineaceae bacterium]
MASSVAPDAIQLVSHSAQETQTMGEAIGRAAQAGLVIALQGELGAGKTTLTQGIGRGLGVTVRMTSPTFTLVNEYDGMAVRLIHMDSYRLGENHTDAVAQAETFGVDELLDAPETVVVIEWADRLAELLPDDTLFVQLAYCPHELECRTLSVAGRGARPRAVVAALLPFLPAQD